MGRSHSSDSSSCHSLCQNIIQHTARILQITVAARPGDIHFTEVYAPHDRTEVEQQKLSFWDKLSEIVSHIPIPEQYFILGDFNVRVQGRFQTEQDFLGPYVYGKGHQYANTYPDSNRTLYTSLLKAQGAINAFPFKQPDLLKHVTYKDKLTPPKTSLGPGVSPRYYFWEYVGKPKNTVIYSSFRGSPRLNRAISWVAFFSENATFARMSQEKLRACFA